MLAGPARKLNPFAGALGLTAEGGAPNKGLLVGDEADAAAPNENEAFAGVADEEAKDMLANGLALGGVPSWAVGATGVV